jgi:hypothetical protein
MSIAFVTSLAANCFFQLAAKPVLGLFGSSYADQAAWCLRILVLTAFPTVIISHYISFCRIQDRIAAAMRTMVIWGILQLIAAVLGANLGGLLGLSLCLFLAVTLEAISILPTVYKVMRPVKSPLPQLAVEGNNRETEAIWLADTIMLAAIPSIYTMGAQLEVAAYPKRVEPLQRAFSEHHHSTSTRLRPRPVRLQHLSYQERVPWRSLTAIEEADTEAITAYKAKS